MDPRVRSLRRYPVKSMGGESLDEVAVDDRGLVGDRRFAVVDTAGSLASGKDSRRFRRRDAVFEYAAATVGDAVTVARSAGGEGWTVGETALDAELTQRMGAEVRVLPERGMSYFDAAPVSLIGTATLEWCAAQFGILADPRRLRANLVIDTEEPFAEEAWVGRRISIGAVEFYVTERVVRCRMIDIDQDGVVAEGRWLKALGAERDLCAAVYLDVLKPGLLRVGDPVIAPPVTTH